MVGKRVPVRARGPRHPSLAMWRPPEARPRGCLRERGAQFVYQRLRIRYELRIKGRGEKPDTELPGMCEKGIRAEGALRGHDKSCMEPADAGGAGAGGVLAAPCEGGEEGEKRGFSSFLVL